MEAVGGQLECNYGYFYYTNTRVSSGELFLLTLYHEASGMICESSWRINCRDVHHCIDNCCGVAPVKCDDITELLILKLHRHSVRHPRLIAGIQPVRCPAFVICIRCGIDRCWDCPCYTRAASAVVANLT